MCIVWNLEPLASGGQSGHKLIPHIICQFLYAWEKTLNEDLFYKGSSANLPRLHTCENKTPFWDKSKPFASQYVFTKLLRNEQDVVQGQFLIGVLLVWIQSSFSEIGCLTKSSEPTLSYSCPIVRGGEKEGCIPLSQRVLARSERKQLRPEFKVETPTPFLTRITVTLIAL